MAEVEIVILSVIIGTLAAIVYSLRVLVLLERRVARMDENLLAIAKRIAVEEVRIEASERQIVKALGVKGTTRKKASKKKATKRKKR